jgi:CRISPR-associated protein Cas2
MEAQMKKPPLRAGESKLWYLVSYDIREPMRYRRAHKVIKGYGEAVQYSVFRCRLSRTQLAGLRWELARILDGEDSLLIVGLCGNCVQRIQAYNRREEWKAQEESFAIL